MDIHSDLRFQAAPLVVDLSIRWQTTKVCIGLLAVLDAPNPDQDVQYLLQKSNFT